ncbi:MAG: hypothetical protein A2711_02260 [Burkholderiales bacterium RIFCSPHIGHO2_01_FULL_63_240]|jgi:4'-phosphopantetheinyl transferase|nr:MAG: hypothetical protein A2711_02260 [Burkholderiales bacterium RIFCSPHIGHO2_01_FULL_63_240]
MTWDVWRARQDWICLTPIPGARVWLIPLPDSGSDVAPALSEATLDCLSTAERQRAQRFIHPRHARLYQAAHAALNVLLAEHVSCSPTALMIEADAQGKPHLVPPTLHFNLSHSDAWALVATHPDHPLGVDIEIHQPSGDHEALARTIFTPDEWQAWSALDSAERGIALFNAWTRKEACIKALGTGLLTPPDQVSVGVSPHPNRGDWLPDPGPRIHWTDLTLHLPKAHSASLAWFNA